MKQDIPVVFRICMSAGIELDLLPIVLLCLGVCLVMGNFYLITRPATCTAV